MIPHLMHLFISKNLIELNIVDRKLNKNIK